jgi:hypothetical protein
MLSNTITIAVYALGVALLIVVAKLLPKDENSNDD